MHVKYLLRAVSSFLIFKWMVRTNVCKLLLLLLFLPLLRSLSGLLTNLFGDRLCLDDLFLHKNSKLIFPVCFSRFINCLFNPLLCNVETKIRNLIQLLLHYLCWHFMLFKHWLRVFKCNLQVHTKTKNQMMK